MGLRLDPHSRIATVPHWTDSGVMVQHAGRAGGVAWSLYFDQTNDEVDCGNGASIMNLHGGAAGFTVDCYWRMPDMSGLANGTIMGLVSQGRWTAPGWCLIMQYVAAGPALNIYLDIDDGGGTPRTVLQNINPAPAVGTWVYMRGRRDAAGNIYLSLDAGAENTTGPWAGATNSADPLRIGHSHSIGLHWGYGNICYVHLWNSDQGALGAIPGSPIALGGNTAARYRFTEGAGLALADDSGNGNNGTIDGATWQQVAPPGWSP